MNSADYVTVICQEGATNKKVFMRDDRVVKKAGRPISNASAQTIHVPTAESLSDLLREISGACSDVICGGYIPGTEGGEVYRIGSVKKIEELTKAKYGGGFVEHDGEQWIARQKQNFAPSSWWLIDRDMATGLPDDLAKLDDEEYIEAVTVILPGFSTASRVRVPSTTGRVLVEGVPMAASGVHYWFQVQDPTLIPDFGKRAKLRAADLGYGYMKLDKNGKGVLWTIFDPSVFSPERVVYDGKPTVVGDRFEVAPADITFEEGGRVDASKITPPDSEQRRQLFEKFKIEVNAKGGRLAVVNTDYLELDTEIDTQAHGVKTVREFWESGDEKWRCQATFRDSDTWNGALRAGYDGMPYLLDYGGETRYELKPDDKLTLLQEMFSHAK